jgi:hypothetical protein
LSFFVGSFNCKGQEAISMNNNTLMNNTIPWLTESQSLILNSRVIFAFTCNSLSPQFDTDDMPLGYQPWLLEGTIQNIYKGNLSASAGTAFNTQPTIYLGPVHSRPVGIWYGYEQSDLPQAGDSWVIFCNPTMENANPTDLLGGKGEGCIAYRSKEVKDDLDLITKFYSDSLPLDSVLELAVKNIGISSPLFYSFLWENLGEQIVKDSAALELFLTILEDSTLNSDCRYTIINGCESFFSMRDGTPGLEKPKYRFIITLFSLLKQKEDENGDLHNNLVETFIPNLLGINSGLTKCSANQVFAGHETEQQAAIKTISESTLKKEAANLLLWLQQ